MTARKGSRRGDPALVLFLAEAVMSPSPIAIDSTVSEGNLTKHFSSIMYI